MFVKIPLLNFAYLMLALESLLFQLCLIIFLFRLGLAIKIPLDSVGFGFRRAQNQSPNPTAQTRKNLLLLSDLTHQPTKPEWCLKFWIRTVGYRRVVALCPPLLASINANHHNHSSRSNFISLSNSNMYHL